MTAFLNMHKAEIALQKEYAFPSALCRFLEYGRGRLLNSPCDAPSLPEAADFEPLVKMLVTARDAYGSDLTLGLDAGDAEIVIPLLAAFNLGNYACEAADHLTAPADHAQDIAMEDVFELSDDIEDLPFGRLIPCNELRRELLGQIPQENHFLFTWLTECVQFDIDSLERIIQTWDELWDKTAPGDDAEALVPVLTAIQSDTALMDHLKAEAGFHTSVMKAAGEVSRQQHMERIRRSAEEGPGIMDHLVSWFRMPAVSGAVALVLMVGIYFGTQVGKDGQPMPIGVTMEMLVYQDGLAVRGGEETKPDVRKPGDIPPEEGDAIQLRFTLDEEAYIYLYHQESSDKRELLFSGKLEKGTHVFPDKSKRMRIGKPGEDEYIILMASERALNKIDQTNAMVNKTNQPGLIIIELEL
ncbi:DUF4384 domain-containing protein [Desulfovibrio sp. Huiquan2017]|uniref:DUF4384 domain-containing protein n=1 Tax=Desulfovibrio sp. Huiquan2017 TaxID=2816861 RepID=UPI001A931E75|nr:DUF4384 domain-containing protein [Desulfovibrio sp. Huiquan2017]